MKKFVPFTLIILLIGGGCGVTVKTAIRNVNYTLAKAVVETDKQVTAYVESDVGTLNMCKEIIVKHREAGVYDEDAATRECEAKIAEFEKSYDRAMTTIALSQEILDDGLDVWDGIDKQERMNIIRGVMKAIMDLTAILEKNNVDIPDVVVDALDGLQRVFDAI